MNKPEEIFDKKYSGEEKTEAIDTFIEETETSIEEEIEREVVRYGINKPRTQTIRARIIR